jgi:translation elongation factor EF-1alpha
MHCTMEDIRVSKVNAVRKDGKMVKATFLKSGDVGNVHLRCERELNLEKHAFMNCLGRFTLRSGGCTIGYGEVKKILVETLLTK